MNFNLEFNEKEFIILHHWLEKEVNKRINNGDNSWQDYDVILYKLCDAVSCKSINEIH